MKTRFLVVGAMLLGCIASIACGVFRSPKHISHAPVPEIHRDADAIQVIWIGHATALIRLNNTWILTDPVFSERIGGVYKRYQMPGRTIEELPTIDVILLSHPHLDHLDERSLKAVVAQSPQVQIIGTADTLSHLPDELQSRAQSLSTWQRSYHSDLVITAVPAHHGNGRWIVDGIWNRHASAGFIMENKGHTVYFAGDTGYHAKTFTDIGRRFKIDVALLPVGPAGRPDWVHSLRKSVHASPTDAMQIFADVGADYMIPLHFGTFFKPDSEELGDIRSAIKTSGKFRQVSLLQAGESVAFLRSDACAPALTCPYRTNDATQILISNEKSQLHDNAELARRSDDQLLEFD